MVLRRVSERQRVPVNFNVTAVISFVLMKVSRGRGRTKGAQSFRLTDSVV